MDADVLGQGSTEVEGHGVGVGWGAGGGGGGGGGCLRGGSLYDLFMSQRKTTELESEASG